MTDNNQSTEEPTQEKASISIDVDDTLNSAISKILKGEKDITIYLSEKMARQIARAIFFNKKIATVPSMNDIPFINDTGEKLCQAKIKIIYKD